MVKFSYINVTVNVNLKNPIIGFKQFKIGRNVAKNHTKNRSHISVKKTLGHRLQNSKMSFWDSQHL
jgi:hypothetical protein